MFVGIDGEWSHDGYFLFCFVEENGAVDYTYSKKEAIEKLKTTYRNHTLVGHNLKADFRALGYWPDNPIMDTLLLSWLQNENGSHGLKDLAPRVLGRELEDPIVKDKSKTPVEIWWRTRGQSLATADQEDIRTYCIQDCEAALEMFLKEYQETYKEQEDNYQKELEFARVCWLMEKRGISLDWNAVTVLHSQLATKQEEARTRLSALFSGSFNPDSPKQVAEMLYLGGTALSVSVPERTKYCSHKKLWVDCDEAFCPDKFVNRRRLEDLDGWNLPQPRHDITSRAALEELLVLDEVPPMAEKFIELVLDHRAYSKLTGTYTSKYHLMKAQDGKIHPFFNPVGTVTGRVSCNNPNFQNQPSKGTWGIPFRNLFVPEQGKVFLVADLDQIEYRLIAEACGAQHLIQAFKDGEDIHSVVAELLGLDPATQRYAAKNINFALGYGAGPEKVAAMMLSSGHRMSTAQVKVLMNKYDEMIPEIPAWKEKLLAIHRQFGYIYTLGGRKRRVPGLDSFNRGLRFRAERQVVNSFVQGSAADLFKDSCVRMDQKGVNLILQVHDEVIAECRPEEVEHQSAGIIQSFGEAAKAMNLQVPITAEVKEVTRWGQSKG